MADIDPSTKLILDFLNDPLKAFPERDKIRENINKILLSIKELIDNPETSIEVKRQALDVIYQELQFKYSIGSFAYEFNIYKNKTKVEDIDFNIISEILQKAIDDK